MIRSTVYASATYAVSGLIGRLGSLLILPIMAKRLTPEDYGRWDVMSSFGAALMAFVTLEISQGLARYYAAETNDRARRQYGSTSLYFVVITIAAMFIVGLLNASGIARHVLRDQALTDLAVLGATFVALNALVNHIQGQLRWDMKPALFALVNLSQAGTGIALSLLLVIHLDMGLTGFMLGQTAGVAIGVLIGSVVIRRFFRWDFSAVRLKEMLAFSVPLIPAAFISIANLYVDRLAITQLLGLSELGIYGMAMRFASTAVILTYGVQMALPPLIYGGLQDPGTPGQVATMMRYFIAAATLLWASVALFSREIINLLTAPAYADAAGLLPVLFAANIIAIIYVFTPGLAVAKRPKSILAIYAVGAVVNAAATYALVATVGIIGAGLGVLASNLVIAAGMAAMGREAFAPPFEWGRIGLAVLVAAAAVGCGWILGLGAWQFAAKIGLLLALAPLFVALGMPHWREIAVISDGIRGWRKAASK